MPVNPISFNSTDLFFTVGAGGGAGRFSLLPHTHARLLAERYQSALSRMGPQTMRDN